MVQHIRKYFHRNDMKMSDGRQVLPNFNESAVRKIPLIKNDPVERQSTVVLGEVVETAAASIARSSSQSIPAVLRNTSKPRKITVYRISPNTLNFQAQNRSSQEQSLPAIAHGAVSNFTTVHPSPCDTAMLADADEGELYQRLACSEKIPITCRNKHAYLHKSKLGSGKKGKCINFEDEWFTPSEFENHCGLEMSKDWKRSIRYGGRAMQTLIQKGFIRPHASSCTCGICSEDLSIVAPVKFYTPKLRKKRTYAEAFSTLEDMSAVTTELIGNEQINAPSLRNNDARIPNELINLLQSTSAPFHEIIKYIFEAVNKNTAEDRRAWAQLKSQADEIFDKYAKLQEAIEKTKLECDERRNGLLQEIITTLKNCDSSNYGNSAISLRLEKPLDQDEVGDEDGTEICQACGRPANSECTGCHKATYCSTECQEKDWNAGHRDACRGLQCQGSSSRNNMDGLLA